jgi:hypothetical protein
VLRGENFDQVEKAYGLADDEFIFSSGLWVRVVFDFAVAFNFGPVACDEVVDALLPLFCARTAHFVRKTEDMTSFESEIEVERTAETFEAMKDYLRHYWRLAEEACA